MRLSGGEVTKVDKGLTKVVRTVEEVEEQRE